MYLVEKNVYQEIKEGVKMEGKNSLKEKSLYVIKYFDKERQKLWLLIWAPQSSDNCVWGDTKQKKEEWSAVVSFTLSEFLLLLPLKGHIISPTTLAPVRLYQTVAIRKCTFHFFYEFRAAT